MNKSIIINYYLLAARLTIAVIFIISGIEKISSPEEFAVSVSNYKILPLASVNIIAVILPWLELICGTLLFLGVSVKENSSIILLMLIIFTIAIFVSILRGLNIECGCFGDDSKIGFFKMVENIILILVTLTLTKYGSDYLKLKSS